MIEKVLSFKIQTSIILTLACLSLISCDKKAADYELDSHSFTAQTLDMIQTNIGVTLPIGSTGLNMYYHGSALKPALLAKIQIPPKSAEALADRVRRITYHEVSGTESSTNKWSWWTPMKQDVIVNRQFIGPDAAFVHLILCKEKDSGHWILYVEWAAV